LFGVTLGRWRRRGLYRVTATVLGQYGWPFAARRRLGLLTTIRAVRCSAHTELSMGDLYLNALPVVVTSGLDEVVGRVWRRENDVDEELREHPAREREFGHRSFNTETFVWPTPGGALPNEYAERGAEITLGKLPAAVLASAVREAAVRQLMSMGFERRSNHVAHGARLSRRKVNLATKVVRTLPENVGAYAAISLQAMPLVGEGMDPGEVALIIDQKVDYVLDIPLADLSRSGIDLTDVRLRWQHQPDCQCGADVRIGDAGRYLDGDLGGTVSVRDGGGDHVSASAGCLAVHANATMMARYLASLNGRSERDISEALREAASAFAETGKRWTNLEKTARSFGTLTLFENVTAELQSPLLVEPCSNLAGQRAPLALPSVTEGQLNFSYGAPRLADSAARGLERHGPYDEGQARSDVLRAIFVSPQEFADEARKLQRILTDGIERFQGLKSRYHLRDFQSDLHLFPEATRAGYENAVLAAAKRSPDIVFFVIKREHRYARRGQNPYLAAKSVLASSGIASQAVTIETLHQPDTMLQWSSDSVGLAAYTKVGNIPYVLHDPTGGRELVLGVGRADVFDPANGYRRQRFGASVAVRQDGDFLFAGSTTPVSTDEDYETQLARLLTDNIARFSQEQGGDPDRVVIYVFKRTGKHELWAVKRSIGDRDIRFALVHVNRDSPLWLVERHGNRVTAPPRGTTIGVSIRDRLLVTGDPRKPAGAHPLRLTLDDKSTYRDMKRIVQQAYGFTKTSYRGFLQSNEPSPILFGRLLAQKVEQLVPYGFNPATAAGPLGDRPWFL
jgi:hypothetical protein